MDRSQKSSPSKHAASTLGVGQGRGECGHHIRKTTPGAGAQGLRGPDKESRPPEHHGMTVPLARAAGSSGGASRAGGPRRVGGWQKQMREDSAGMGF